MTSFFQKERTQLERNVLAQKIRRPWVQKPTRRNGGGAENPTESTEPFSFFAERKRKTH